MRFGRSIPPRRVSLVRTDGLTVRVPGRPAQQHAVLVPRLGDLDARMEMEAHGVGHGQGARTKVLPEGLAPVQQVPERERYPVLLANGNLVVGTDDGRLIAYRPD